MNFVFIALGVALLVFGLAQLLHIIVVIVSRMGNTVGFMIFKPVYVGVSAAVGLWLLSLGGVI